MITWTVIEYYDYLLLLLYGGVFFLLARKFAKKHSETPREFYWLLVSWWIKVIACILYAWLYVYYYKFGDSLGYKDRSDALVDSVLKDWENIKYIFLPVDSFKEYLSNQGYSNLPYLSDLGYYSESLFIISRISAVAAFFTFNRFLIISFVFTNIAYYGFVMMYTTSKKIVRGYHKELAIGCLFIPSCLFWSSGLAKEPVCILSLGIIFSCLVKLFFQKKISLTTISLLIIFSYLLNTVKNYIFSLFLFAFIFWILYNGIKKLMLKSKLTKIAIVPIFIIIVTVGISSFSNLLLEIARSNIGEIITSNIDNYESMASSIQRGSLIEVKDIDVSNITGILKFIPQGLVNVFFRPFPWEISNVLMIFTVLENLFFMFLFFKVLIKSRFFTKNLFIDKNYQVLMIIFSIGMAFIIGISTFNLGSMARYKMPFLPFWACFLLIINKKPFQKTRLKNQDKTLERYPVNDHLLSTYGNQNNLSL